MEAKSHHVLLGTDEESISSTTTWVSSFDPFSAVPVITVVH
jgi:hypothetical protein